MKVLLFCAKFDKGGGPVITQFSKLKVGIFLFCSFFLTFAVEIVGCPPERSVHCGKRRKIPIWKRESLICGSCRCLRILRKLTFSDSSTRRSSSATSPPLLTTRRSERKTRMFFFWFNFVCGNRRFRICSRVCSSWERCLFPMRLWFTRQEQEERKKEERRKRRDLCDDDCVRYN